jgi:geranylgeranyl diphosphate synthase type I
VPDRVCQVAELLHTGSLVIDDIQDGATSRRGGPAAHVAHGVPAALNAANTAYFHAFAILRRALPRERRLRALDMLADELVTAHLGQALDLSLGDRVAAGGLRAAHHLALARAKTGALLRIAARLGAIAAGASEADEAALAAWAGEVGIAYQIQNDLADLSGPMADVAAGRPTHPLLLALERGGRAAAMLRRLLGRGRLAEADLRALRRALDAAGVAQESRRAARAAAERAYAALSRLPASEARAALGRMTAEIAGT